MVTRDYPVELKITVGGHIDDVVSLLDMTEGRPRQVWFLEDDTPGLNTEVPLLSAGVILRLRTDSKRDQSTVKLRPARLSQLGDRWLQANEGGEEDYRIEGDWAGDRKVLAASCVTEFPPGTFGVLMASDGDLSVAFTERQLEFIVECAGIPLNISGLTAFGPIAATQWKEQKLGNIEVNGERWTVDGLDFLELSARADDQVQAVEKQVALTAAASAHGVGLAAEQIPKTTTVLRHLMQQHPR